MRLDGFVLLPVAVSGLPVDLMIPLHTGEEVTAMFCNSYGRPGVDKFIGICAKQQPHVKWDGRPQLLTDCDLQAVVDYVCRMKDILSSIASRGELTALMDSLNLLRCNSCGESGK